MEIEPFVIEADASRHLLKITLRGSWDRLTVDQYREALLDAEKSMAPAGDVLILIDARELHVQQQDVAERYKQIAIHKRFPPRKLAMIMSSALVTLQVRRIGSGRQRFFECEEDAKDWLFAP